MFQRILAFGVLSSVIGYAGSPARSPAKSAASFQTAVEPFLAKNCFMCHNEKLRSGELDLKSHAQPEKLLKDRDTWEIVVAKIKSGEMPPKGLPRPKPEEVASVAGWIEGEYRRLDAQMAPDPGRVTARRLNRYEYNNTVRDMTGVTFRPADDFPADDSGYGFDNIGDVLSLSPVLMEKYMAAAEKIARRAIWVGPPQFKPTRVLLKAETAGMGEHLKVAPLKPGFAGPMPSKTALHMRYQFPVQADYEIRVSLGGVRPETAPPVKMVFWVDGSADTGLRSCPAARQETEFRDEAPGARGFSSAERGFRKRRFRSRAEPDRARAIVTWRSRLLKFADLSTRLRLLYLPAINF